MKRLLVILFITLLGVFRPYSQVFAQAGDQNPAQKSGLSITPPLSEIMLKPGKSITQAFTIKNEGTVDLQVTPTIADFSPDGSTGIPIVLPDNTSFPFAKLENLDKKLGVPFALAAGQSQQLVLRVNIPATEPEHDYYKTFLFKTEPLGLTQLDGAHTVSQAYVGVHLLISVSNSGLDLGKLSIDQLSTLPIVDMFSSINLRVFAKNTGNTYTKAHGEIKITNMLGQVVKIFPFLPENVLAGSMRELHGSAQDPDDTKSAIATPFEYRPLFLFGPYEILGTIRGEAQESSVEKKTTVWALPISPLLVILLTWLGFKIARRMQKERREDESY